MKLIPLYDETAPIACTLSEDEIPGRIELVERMRSNLERLERTEHGMLLHFPVRRDIEDDLQRFAVDEKRLLRVLGVRGPQRRGPDAPMGCAAFGQRAGRSARGVLRG